MYMYMYAVGYTPTPPITSMFLRKKGPVSMKVDGDEVVDFGEPLPPAVEVKPGGEPRTH